MPNTNVFARTKKKPVSSRIILLWAMLAGLVCGLIDLGQPIENSIHNLRSAINSRPASKNIVIVKIDDESMQQLGSWPWPRTTHAAIVDRLTQAGARKILLDVRFNLRSDKQSDDRFADALRRSARVTLPVFIGEDRSSSEFPIDQFAKDSSVASVYLKTRFDSRVRELDYDVDTPRGRIPGFAAKIAGLTLLPEGKFPVDYSVNPATFNTVSAADLINGKIPTNKIAGKIAVVGITTDSLGDQWIIPRYGRTSGVFVHALGGETLIRGRPTSMGWIPAFLVAAATGALAIATRRSLWQNLILIGSTFVLMFGPTAFEAKLIYFDVVPALLALLVLFWQMNWQRLRNRTTINDVSGLPNFIALRADPLVKERPIVVARVHNYAEIVSALPAESERLLAEQLASRLCIGAAGRRLYHGGEGLFAWLAEPTIPLGHHLEALHALFRSPVKVQGNPYDVMVSFGVDNGVDRALANRLGSAQVAAAEAETEGLKWKYHDPARLADASWKLSLLSQLDAAIDQGEVWVAFQPKLDLSSGQIVGVEALARWTHPEKGPISPAEFIGAAEQHDRIERLTDFILDEAVSGIAHISKQGHRLNLAVNLSARLLTDARLPERVKSCLARHRLPPEQLTLEVTETAALAGSGQDLAMFRALRDLGVKISIDDYGTGLSTLDYLKRIPASEIKIDQSFIKPLRENRSDRVMVQSTIGLAHSLGRIVVAEGVEDRDTLELLGEMGCDVVQGFMIGRPTSLRNIIKQMKEDRGLRVA